MWLKSSKARFVSDGSEFELISKGNGPTIKLVKSKTSPSKKYTQQHIAEVEALLAKMPGHPTGKLGNPIPDDYPGLSFDEAVKLEMLISNRNLKQAKRAVEYYRRHIVRHNGLNKNSHS